MKNLEKTLLAFCQLFPNKHLLSKARLTKMVYLADWEYAKKYKKQITDIQWYFHNYGPFVDDVFEAALNSSYLNIINSINMYGDEKTIINLSGKPFNIQIEDNIYNIIEDVIYSTKDLNWNEFIGYVYDTFPIKQQDRYIDLDLIELANQYEESLKDNYPLDLLGI